VGHLTLLIGMNVESSSEYDVQDSMCSQKARVTCSSITYKNIEMVCMKFLTVH
jgi:hypothetical protein